MSDYECIEHGKTKYPILVLRVFHDEGLFSDRNQPMFQYPKSMKLREAELLPIKGVDDKKRGYNPPNGKDENMGGTTAKKVSLGGKSGWKKRGRLGICLAGWPDNRRHSTLKDAWLGHNLRSRNCLLFHSFTRDTAYTLPIEP